MNIHYTVVLLILQILQECTVCLSGLRMVWRQCVTVWEDIYVNKGKLLLLKKKEKVVKTPSPTFRLDCVLYHNSLSAHFAKQGLFYRNFMLSKMLLCQLCCSGRGSNFTFCSSSSDTHWKWNSDGSYSVYMKKYLDSTTFVKYLLCRTLLFHSHHVHHWSMYL